MKIGIPKGLLYYRYYPFIETFLKELNAEIIISEDTNKTILNEGIKYCVDEACLPIKIFHGHVSSIKDKCDMMIIPRIMSIRNKEFICPKFCGLPEMIKCSIEDMPPITEMPLYMDNEKILYEWTKKIGLIVTKDTYAIKKAYLTAMQVQQNFKFGINDDKFDTKIALLGHPYNIYDKYVNMNIVNKLHKCGVGVMTEEFIKEDYIKQEVGKLFKRPFWSFARESYGTAAYLALNKKVNGIIYISSFACGIDSVVIELIKDRIKDFPMLVIKIDEQTGEAGMDTRIEAFVDMLERRKNIESNFSTHGKCVYSG